LREDVRTIIDACLDTYITERPHESLGQVPPLTFLLRPAADVTPKNDGRARLE